MREYPLGESAQVIELAEDISVEATVRVTALSRILGGLAAEIPGIEEIQPTYTGIAVHFRPELISPSYVSALVRRALDILEGETPRSPEEVAALERNSCVLEVPVLYGGDAGPDLAASAAELGLEPAELIRRHSAGEYLVHMIGFTPGFPYLGTLDPSISLPRLKTARTLVPAGSVGIALRQTGIYSIPAPGGWRIIGRTPLELFDPRGDRPFLFEPGMRVRFRPVTRKEFEQIAARDRKRTPAPVQTCGGPHGKPGPSRSVPALEVENPGFFSTVQDLGRKGFRSYGVPLSGAMDPVSHIRANMLVGNPPDAAGIEMTYSGACFRALFEIPVAVTGAPAEVTVNGSPVSPGVPFVLGKSSVLRIGPAAKGSRIYLSVAGGIAVPAVLGSRSTCVRASLGGLSGRPLRAGDVLEAGPHPAPPWLGSRDPGSNTIFPDVRDEVYVRLLPGPESESGLLERLFSFPYRVTPACDRMGLRLEGRPLVTGKTDIVSGAVIPGVVQLGSDGLPVVILADGQTTGGYWRIGVVASADLPVLGQVRPGTTVRFVPVGHDTALELLRKLIPTA